MSSQSNKSARQQAMHAAEIAASLSEKIPFIHRMDFTMAGLVSLGILVIGIFSAVFMFSEMNHVVNEVNEERIEAALFSMNSMLEDYKAESSETSQRLADSDEIVEGIQARDGAALKEAALAIIKDKRLGGSFVMITDDKGQVLTRAHNDEAGDNIAHQFNVSHALKGESVAFTDFGKAQKLTIRAGTPVKDDEGKIIGTVSAGYFLDDSSIVDKIKSLTGNDFTVFQGDIRINTTIRHNGKRAIGTRLDSTIADIVLGEGKPYSGTSDIFGVPHAAAYQPIFGFEGKPIGAYVTAISLASTQNAITRALVGSVAVEIAVVILMIICYILITKKILRPMDSILTAANDFSQGNLEARACLVNNNEIGRISYVFNHMADRIQQLVNNLEDTVDTRTQQLIEQKDQFRLILDTTAEGIFGTDLEGNCTFCNQSCLELLGYQKEEDLMGCKMSTLIFQSWKEGIPKLPQSDPLGGHIHTQLTREDVVRCADGTLLDVQYRILPKYQDGNHTGYVISFADISERKKDEEKINFLSNHDSLTGLINRRYFDSLMSKIDASQDLPIAVIFLDLNGLKLLNDIFGHEAGDQLIMKAAKIINLNCRQNDIPARLGGDEFVVLLPNTNKEDAQKTADRIKLELSLEKINKIPCSISAGISTKEQFSSSIYKVMQDAEIEMYKEKTAVGKRLGSDSIHSVLSLLHEKCPAQKTHSEEVSMLCEKMGHALKVAEDKVKKLRDAGYLHDIGKITLPESILNKPIDKLNQDELELYRQHPAVGYRILNLSQDKLDLASAIYGHHECWDGSGYPKKLKGEEIPFISRVIGVAETYLYSLHTQKYSANREKKALQHVAEQAGITLDPAIVKVFIEMMNA